MSAAIPLDQRRRDRWTRAGLFGTYVCATFALLGVAPASGGLALLSLAFLVQFRDWRLLRSEPVAVAAATFGGYILVQSLVAYLQAPTPAVAAAIAETAPDWLKLLLFVPLAYWVAGRPERARLVLALALLGFSIGFLRKIDWAGFDASFFTTRFENYLPAIAFGMFTGLGVLGLIAARRALWTIAERPRWRGLSQVVWTLWLLLLLEGLLLSQSRGSWLAFLVGGALLLILEWRARPAAARYRPLHWKPLVFLALTGLVILGLQHQTLGERLGDQRETLGEVLGGELDQVAADPIGLRIHALVFGLELWRERPLLGWGAGSSRPLIAASGRPGELVDGDDWLPHLHNSYVEALVQLGAVGAALAALLLTVLIGTTHRECRDGRLPADLCRLLLVTLIFTLVWSAFNYRVVRTDWIFFWILVAGTAYSFPLARRLAGAAVPGKAPSSAAPPSALGEAETAAAAPPP